MVHKGSLENKLKIFTLCFLSMQIIKLNECLFDIRLTVSHSPYPKPHMRQFTSAIPHHHVGKQASSCNNCTLLGWPVFADRARPDFSTKLCFGMVQDSRSKHENFWHVKQRNLKKTILTSRPLYLGSCSRVVDVSDAPFMDDWTSWSWLILVDISIRRLWASLFNSLKSSH